MEDIPAEQAVYGRAAEECRSLSRLIELIEVSIGHANSILYSIEDITRLPNASPSSLRNRDSGYSEGRGPINGGGLNRILLHLERKVEENRAYLRDLQRAKLGGLQVIIEEPEGQYAVYYKAISNSLTDIIAIIIKALRSRIETNVEASKELHRLLEYSPELLHISRPDLEEVLPPIINILSLNNRLSQVLDRWDLPFPPHNRRLSLCNSAKLLNSGRNTGVLEHAHLRNVDMQVIKRKGGCFQFWKCPNCGFRVRYHATCARSLDIEATDEVRRPGKGHIALRNVFLAKSHLHKQPGQLWKYACLFCIGSGKSLQGGSTTFAKEDELADHIDECHDIKSLPRLFMDKLFVAAPDERPESRCDIQFHRTRSTLRILQI
jgi:hypothetical protein